MNLRSKQNGFEEIKIEIKEKIDKSEKESEILDKRYNIKNIATFDPDFERVDFLEINMPE